MPETTYLHITAIPQPGLHSSDDDGVTWTWRVNDGTFAYSTSPLLPSSTIYRIGVGPGKRLEKSVDKGSTWAPVGNLPPRQVSQNERALVCLGDGSIITTATSQAGDPPAIVQRTTDEGASWSVIGVGDASSNSNIRFSLYRKTTPPGTVFGIFLHGSPSSFGLYRSLDYGLTWARVFSGATFGLDARWQIHSVFTTRANTLLLILVRAQTFTPPYDFRIYRSTNNGTTWSLVLQDSAQQKTIDANARVHSNITQIPSTGRLFTFVWYSDDDGQTWALHPSPPAPTNEGCGLSRTAAFLTASVTSPILRSVDGVTWTSIGFPGAIQEGYPDSLLALPPLAPAGLKAQRMGMVLGTRRIRRGRTTPIAP